MINLAAVFVGGGLGALTRYLLALSFLKFHFYGFPTGTFVANFISCLILGFIWGILINRLALSPQLHLLLATGFCGGLSTFSTLALENFEMLKTGKFLMPLFYTVTSLILGMLGIWLAQKFIPR